MTALPPLTQKRPSRPPTPTEEDSTAAALAALRERLPPIRPPSPIRRKFRPAPPVLSYAKPHRQPQQKIDYDKERRAIDKTEAQQRPVIEAEEQKLFSHLLVAHLRRIAEMEESVPYREASTRDALLRDEDREYMILLSEHEAKTQRIHDREVVAVNLRKHLMAIEQDERRREIAGDEDAAFRAIVHRELVFRPGGSDNVPRKLKAPRPPKERVVKGARASNSPQNEQLDFYVDHGRKKWDEERAQRGQLMAAIAAVNGMFPTEAKLREDIVGEELSQRLSLEHLLFQRTHEMTKVVEELEKVREAERHQVAKAHSAAAEDAVDRALGNALAAAAQRRVEEVEAPHHAAVHNDAAAAAPVSAPTATADVAAPKPSVPHVPSKSAVGVATPTTAPLSAHNSQDGKVDLLSQAAVQSLKSTEKQYTAMELVTLVDEVSQNLFPVADKKDDWKTSGIAAIRVAQHEVAHPTEHHESLKAVNPTASSSSHSNHQSSATASSIVSTAAAAAAEPMPAAPLPAQQETVVTPPRPLFPFLDALCDVLLDEEDDESTKRAHNTWRQLLAAVVEIESEASSANPTSVEPCHNIHRFYVGHNISQVTRDYLENVLWRVGHHHTDIVNAIELIPVRWTAYTQNDMEEEEKMEVMFGEMLGREKKIREQIEEYIGLLHMFEVRVNSPRRKA